MLKYLFLCTYNCSRFSLILYKDLITLCSAILNFFIYGDAGNTVFENGSFSILLIESSIEFTLFIISC